MDLKGRSFLKLLDFTQEEILYLVDLAIELKEKRKQGLKGEEYRFDFREAVHKNPLCIYHWRAG